jgi:hypothetical protein
VAERTNETGRQQDAHRRQNRDDESVVAKPSPVQVKPGFEEQARE